MSDVNDADLIMIPSSDDESVPLYDAASLPPPPRAADLPVASSDWNAAPWYCNNRGCKKGRHYVGEDSRPNNYDLDDEYWWCCEECDALSIKKARIQ